MDSSLQSMAFEYTELSASTSKRLFEVLPRRDQIHIRLWEEKEDVPYRCLSYTWGEPTPCFPIYVNGKQMQVRKNLYEFLTVAAQRYANEPLWIDAICINQGNDTEKSVQVQRMGDIYQQAAEILVWLGHDPAMEKFLKWIRKPKRKILYYCSTHASPRRLRKDIKIIAEHPYWTRAWIVQEVLLASSVRLVCGHTEAPSDGVLKYDDWPLADLVARFRLPDIVWDKAAGIDQHFRKLSKVDDGYQKMWRLFKIASKYKTDKSKNFWEVFERLTKGAHSSDPRDRIYSILAITGHQSSFTVDYSESCVDTFWRAAEYFESWAMPQRIEDFWEALCLTDEDKLSVRSRQIPLQCEIVLRSSKPVPKLSPSPMSRLGKPFHCCEHDRNKMHSFDCRDGDLLLCPCPGPGRSGALCHILIRRREHADSESFQILSSKF